MRSGVLAAGLFGFWFLLSGLTDGFHLGAGAAAAIGIAIGTRAVFRDRPGLGVGPRWIPFLAWLVFAILLSAARVARIVLSPTLRISPAIRRFRDGLPHAPARAVLAHSITLTPGTVTLDSEDGELAVHALEGDEPSQALRSRMARLYR